MFSHCHRPSLVSVPMQLISYCVICARIRALLRGKLTPDSGTFVKCTYLVKPCMVYHSMYSMPDQTNIAHIFKCVSPSPLVNTIPRQGQIFSKWVLVLTNLLHHLKGLCMMSITQSTLWNSSVWLSTAYSMQRTSPQMCAALQVGISAAHWAPPAEREFGLFNRVTAS